VRLFAHFGIGFVFGTCTGLGLLVELDWDVLLKVSYLIEDLEPMAPGHLRKVLSSARRISGRSSGMKCPLGIALP
jgi:hypothetical protein